MDDAPADDACQGAEVPDRTAELIARRRHLPPVDPEALRRDVDAAVEQAL